MCVRNVLLRIDWIMQSRGRTTRTKLTCRTTVAAATPAAAGAVGVATPAVAATRAAAGGAGAATLAAATAATAGGDAATAGTTAADGAARAPTRSRSPCTARSSPRSITEAASKDAWTRIVANKYYVHVHNRAYSTTSPAEVWF